MKTFYMYMCPDCKRSYLSPVRRTNADGDITPTCEHTMHSRSGVVGDYSKHIPTTYVGKLAVDDA